MNIATAQLNVDVFHRAPTPLPAKQLREHSLLHIALPSTQIGCRNLRPARFLVLFKIRARPIWPLVLISSD